MKKEIIISLIVLLFSAYSNCQVNNNLTFKLIENDLIDFLIRKNEIRKHQIIDFKNGNYKIHLIGLQNGYNKNNLINGIYSFSSGFTHTKVYYLIVENSNFIILDLSNRKGLNTAIKKVLDFCEGQKYCSDITEDYIKRIIGVYYKINKNPSTRVDKNCEILIIETKELP